MLRKWLLLCLAALSASGQERAPEKGTISGTVTDALTGVPLGKAEIRTEGPARLFTVSDAKGGFRLLDVPAGAYRLMGSRNGYLDGKPAAITVDAGQDVAGVSYKLTPFGVIAGTVRDPDGEALSDVEVTAYRVSYRNGHRKTTGSDEFRTDDLGQYRITGLEPGRYFVVARPQRRDAFRYEDHSAPGRAREVLVPALYPGVTDPNAAAQVALAAGTRAAGIDVVLPRRAVVSVAGRVNAPPGALAPGVFLYPVGAEDGEMGFSWQAVNGEKGEFSFPSIPAGDYVLSASTRFPGRPTSDILELIASREELKGQTALHVGELPLRDVRVTVQPGAEITGVVRSEEEQDLKFGEKRIHFDPGEASDTTPTVRDDRTFAATLSPGRYAVSVGLGGEYFVLRALADGRDVTDGGLTITGPGKISVEVIVSKAWGKLEGVVSDKDGAPLSGITVVLIPEERLRWRSDLFIHGQTDQKGAYRMAVPPGKYKLFAWKDVEDGAWLDPDFLRNYESKGLAITVEPKGQATQNLTVLP